MRVIAGRFKGRRLVAPDTADTRPVTDRVKEAVFSSLGARLDDARVADLYAGAGSFGIEALSRGAASVVFVESGRRALEALHRNLAVVDVDAEVVSRPVEQWVGVARGPFEVVFCDPPWVLTATELEEVLARLLDAVDPDGVVVVSRRATDPVPRPPGWRIDDDRRYGDTRILRYVPETPPTSERGDPS